MVSKKIIEDNETAARNLYATGNYVSCFLLIHSLIEALLRTFLNNKKDGFNGLIIAYKKFLQKEKQKKTTFVDELTTFNKRRNRVVHELWEKGYTETNNKLEPACRTAFLIYGLLIEWLETFSFDSKHSGFENS